MELLWVIIGIVLVWKFAGVLTSLATAGRTKSEVFCEEVLMEAAEERAENIQAFQERMKNKEINSHQEVMALLKIKK